MRFARPVLAGLLLVIVAVGGLYLVSPDFRGQIQGAVTPSCTVGLTGAAVSVTVQGADAQAQCESFLDQTTDGGSWYIYSGGQKPAGAVICQVSYRGEMFTVRDQGSLNIYGSGICSNLIKLANGQPLTTREPTVDPGIDVVCGLRVAGHNATVLADLDLCSAFAREYPPADGSWEIYEASTPPSGDRLICEGVWAAPDTYWGSVEIWDSGGASYATDLCRRLGW